MPRATAHRRDRRSSPTPADPPPDSPAAVPSRRRHRTTKTSVVTAPTSAHPERYDALFLLGNRRTGLAKVLLCFARSFHLHKLFHPVILLCYGELLGGIPTQSPFTLVAIVLRKGIPPLLPLPSLLPILLPLLSPLIRSTTLTRRNAILLHPQSFLA
ncbi:unnamed protein product [Linum trigynum]|uniref:Uncharacterized protein n=1 Tax=Linum trigynum TaxID=586398 RepID=A0AAV2FGG1_9ROSI